MKESSQAAVVEFLELIPIYSTTRIIVEGIKDKKSLEALGFHKITILNKPLFEIVESITEKHVVILTDLDKEGKKLYSKLKKELTRNGVLIDDKLRMLLFKTDISHIEGLATYVKNWQDL